MTPHAPALAAVIVLAAAALPVRAKTVQNFDTEGTPYVRQVHPAPCQPPEPQVMAGGPFGNFLRIAHDVPRNCNSISFDRSDEGEHGFTVVSFWFRMTPRSGRADGLSFALLNTSVYGTAGPVALEPPLKATEEPDFQRSLGVGLDIYDNRENYERETYSDNHVSIHYDGRVVAVFRIKREELDLGRSSASGSEPPASGRWIHARIIVRAAAGYGDVRVILTPLTSLLTLPAPRFDGQVAVPGLVPYEARVHFGARSGGETAEHDLDEVAVHFSDQPPPTTFHDFDAPGSGFSLGEHCRPPAAALVTGGGHGLALRLADAVQPPPQAPNCNSIAFDRTSPGLHTSVVARFAIRMRPGNNGRADGMGFALLNTARYGARGPVASELPPFVAEEPNFLDSIGVGFDIHQATDTEDRDRQDPSDNHVSIHFDGEKVAAYRIDREILDLAGGERIQVTVKVSHGPSASQVLVSLAPPPPRLPLDLPATTVRRLRPYESRAYFSARSGHASAEHDLDDVEVRWSGLPDPAVYGSWSPPFHFGVLDDAMVKPVVPIHLHLLPTGKVMFWDRHHDQDHEFLHWDGAPRTWDPEGGDFVRAAVPGGGHDIFCAGHSFLADGRLLVAGGHLRDNVGLDRSWTYDPAGDAWCEGPRMAAGRWYPTTTTLANGAALVVSGDIDRDPPAVNRLPEVLDAPEGCPSAPWRRLTDGTRTLPLYPWMFQAPGGRVFNAGPNPDTAFLAVSGTGSWSPPIPRRGDGRNEGSAVMWDNGEVLIMGGGGGKDDPIPPTDEVDLIDLDVVPLVWQPMPSMSYRRRFLTSTLLPDGQVLVTGGTALNGNQTAGAVFVPEMWDPARRRWSLLAGMSVPRLYHSNALLLPDARVLVAGGGHPESDDQGIDHTNGQLYSPPYLFRGMRPSITSVTPSEITFGSTFFVETPDPGGIGDVTLVRLGSVTHTFNQNQRFNRLTFQPGPGGLQVMAPGDPDRCPPGHYMLFLLNHAGTPSEARIVSLGGSGED